MFDCMTHDSTHNGMSLMMPQAAQELATVDVAALEQLSFNLSSDPESRQFNCTLRWIIYRIVEANSGITYVQLKKVLRGEYGIDRRFIDTTISSLTSATLLNAINKWRNPKASVVGSDVGIHLRAMPQKSEAFSVWEKTTLADFPELNCYVPPSVIARKAHGK